MGPFTEDIVGIIFGVPAVVVALVLILRYKLKTKELETRGDAELGAEVDALRDDLDDTRAQLAEVQERLDFAERLIAAGRRSKRTQVGDRVPPTGNVMVGMPHTAHMGLLIPLLSDS